MPADVLWFIGLNNADDRQNPDGADQKHDCADDQPPQKSLVLLFFAAHVAASSPVYSSSIEQLSAFASAGSCDARGIFSPDSHAETADCTVPSMDASSACEIPASIRFYFSPFIFITSVKISHIEIVS